MILLNTKNYSKHIVNLRQPSMYTDLFKTSYEIVVCFRSRQTIGCLTSSHKRCVRSQNGKASGGHPSFSVMPVYGQGYLKQKRTDVVWWLTTKNTRLVFLLLFPITDSTFTCKLRFFMMPFFIHVTLRCVRIGSCCMSQSL